MDNCIKAKYRIWQRIKLGPSLCNWDEAQGGQEGMPTYYQRCPCKSQGNALSPLYQQGPLDSVQTSV